MNVAVCTRHSGSLAGGGADQVVVRGFEALRRHDPENRYIPYHERLGRWGAGSRLRTDAAAFVSDFVLKNTAVPLWARRAGVDVFLHLAPPCLYAQRSIPQVCYIYDVPRAEDNRRWRHRVFNRLVVEASARRADHVLTLSNVTRGEILRTFGLPPERVTVVYPCVDFGVFHPLRGSPELASWLSRVGLKEGYFLGVVSRIVERKNPGAYLEVFARLPAALRRERKLALRGPLSLDEFRPYVSEEVLRAVCDDVVLVPRLADSRALAALYSGASAVLFPSRYEGFGLPVVEAMACGIPIVASDIPAIREVAGDVYPLFQPDDYEGMAGFCLEVEAGAVSCAREEGLGRARGFDDVSFARQVSRVLSTRVTDGR